MYALGWLGLRGRAGVSCALMLSLLDPGTDRTGAWQFGTLCRGLCFPAWQKECQMLGFVEDQIIKQAVISCPHRVRCFSPGRCLSGQSLPAAGA